MKVTTDSCLFGAWVADLLTDQKDRVKQILDIGAGTGLLSLMLAQKMPNSTIEAIEAEEQSARQAIENIGLSPWPNSVTVRHTDIRKYTSRNKFDVIISNPPFYENELKGNNPAKNLAHHDNGLQLKELPDIFKELLHKDGNFFLLLPYKRKDEINKLLIQHNLIINNITLVKQSEKHSYFRIMVCGSMRAIDESPGIHETISKEMYIRNNTDSYTPEFTRLLKDYYLYL